MSRQDLIPEWRPRLGPTHSEGPKALHRYGCRVQGLGFGVEGLGFGVWGSGFRMPGTTLFPFLGLVPFLHPLQPKRAPLLMLGLLGNLDLVRNVDSVSIQGLRRVYQAYYSC